MAVDDAGGGGGGGNNSLDLLSPPPPQSQQQNQCPYNFLKRKHEGADSTISSAEINNQSGNIVAHYHQDSSSSDTNGWKKRHVENGTTPPSPAATTNCFNNSTIDLINNNQISMENTLNIDYSQHIDATLGNINNNNDSSTVNNNSININNNNNNINNNNDVTYNLIGSSTFINDLFGYDGGLIVPVSVNCSASDSIIPATPTFTTVTNVNETFDDSTNWQATDLLELDHRYNSGLQTEITELTATINLRQPESDGQTQQPNSDDHFLVPQKLPIQSDLSTSPLTKYRSVNNLSNLENLTKSDSETDFEDKNLSWLLNFKFDELPHLSPDISNGNVAVNGGSGNTLVGNQKLQSNSSSANDRSRSPKTSSTTKTGKKFEELVMEVTSEVDGNEMVVAENVTVEDTTLVKAVKKPPFTYTELIEYALEDKGELTVSGIYQWISDRFPYYKSNDDRWKNSVRHNLSINPHFRKGVKAPQGAGHLWTISSGDSAENVLAWEHKKQRLELFFKMESMNRERLQQHQQQQQQQQQLAQHQQQCDSPHDHQGCQQQGQCLYEEAAKAAATISQEMQQQQQQQQQSTTTTTITPHNDCTTTTSNNNDNHQRLSNNQILNELPFTDLMSDEELRKTAGQILNGIHREVEVQSVNSIISTYHDVLLDNDYLNPIHKDVAVNESGLRNVTTQQQSQQHNTPSQYYVTEIDPLELGIHINPMSHAVHVHDEEEVLFNDDFNLNYFGFSAGSDIVA